MSPDSSGPDERADDGRGGIGDHGSAPGPGAPGLGDPNPPPPAPTRGSAVRRTVVLAVVVVVAVVVGAVVTNALVDERAPVAGAPTAADGPPRLDAGARSGTDSRPLPDATLEGFADGPPVALSDYRGTPLLVNFWATWCAPCVEEMPDVQQVADALGGELAVLGVNVQDAPANAEAFVAELGIDYDLAVDPAGELYKAVRAFGMPTTLLVDPSGTIVYRHTGPLDAAELRALVADHLGVGASEAAEAAAGSGDERQERAS